MASVISITQVKVLKIRFARSQKTQRGDIFFSSLLISSIILDYHKFLVDFF